MKTRTRIAAAVLALGLAGCASERPYTSYTSPVVTRNPSDVALESSLQTQLSRYGDLAAVSPYVHFHANEGVVTLTGIVPDDRDRQMIEALVRGTAGVQAVNDQMELGSTPPTYPVVVAPVVTTPAPPVVTSGATVVREPAPYVMVQAANPSDQLIARNLAERLQHDSVPATWLEDATITVSAGNVYLQGSVDGRAERNEIVGVCQHTRGVTTVYDELQVR